MGDREREILLPQTHILSNRSFEQRKSLKHSLPNRRQLLYELTIWKLKKKL